MTWKFHPQPQTKTISARTALMGIVNENFLSPWKKNGLYEKLWDFLKPGQSGNNFKKNSYYDYRKLNPNAPAQSIPANCRTYHWKERRFLSLEECKRLFSFPDNFHFTIGSTRQKIFMIGNSVPPNMMRAIGENIKKAPFLQNVKKPTVISFFAGCGGSSLGFKLAGYKELLAVEWKKNAVETFKINFPGVPVYHGDIKKLSGKDCMKLARIKKGELDVLDGSPPCQGFSMSGNRNFNDFRNSLFKEYVRLLQELQPKVFVLENVTGLIIGQMKQIYLKMVKALRACGYEVKGEVLNAQYYNVSQSRRRVIIIGVRNDLNQQIKLKGNSK